MFKSTLFHMLIVSIIAIGFLSCGNETPITEGTSLSDDISPVLNFPERIPADAHINTLIMTNERDWTVYDKYYQNEVLAQHDEVFFSNLQWSTISHLVRNTDFLQNSETENQHYYLSEILDRDYINKPEVVVAILNEMKADVTETSELARIARLVLDKNTKFLSQDNFKKHKERNQEAYQALFDFGYDRWAQER
ncbi:hypothetical protein FUA23_07620 [Neolewinella aurantiaca]|uniref:Uncharacterized protein n=1 Tax=Neolewinella aurantiaca TaxID=2602767 RepID=A0A5C7FGK0_9BACT|nr:hypothetical protein [Neolewinella aurantiaca]TXF90100.1 hypothetical protein FUA23_07620 [Neolewinella aurantiaca]